jgi:immune inhibitor A
MSLQVFAMPPTPNQVIGKNKSGITKVKVRRITEVVPISSTAPAPAMALTGKHRLLVILVETADAKWPRGFSRSRYQEMIFSKSSMSLREYFRENSYGKYDLSGTVLGPLRVSGRISDHKFKMGQSNDPVASLVEKAVRSAGNKIKFSDYDHYDVRGRKGADGILDHVMLVYPAVNNDAQSFRPIWPHRGSTDIDLGRIRVTAYTILNHGAPLGVFVHEFAHDLGLPDLYDRDYSSHGAGRWALMGSGSWAHSGELPSHISAWGKAKLGWLTPTILSETGKNLRVPSSSEKPFAIKLPLGSVDSREYFLIENRRRVGFDRKIPAEGILIWHIDERRPDNDDEAHKMVDVVEAAPVQDLDHIEQGRAPNHLPDVFHARGQNLFHDDTTPSARNSAGKKTGIRVKIRSRAKRVMRIDVTRPKIFDPGGVPFLLENDAYRYGRYSVVPLGKRSEALVSFQTTPGGYLVFGAQIFFVGPKNSKGKASIRIYEDRAGQPGKAILTKKISLRTPADGYYWMDETLAKDERGFRLKADRRYWVGVRNDRGKIYPGLNPQSISKNARFRRGPKKPLVAHFNFVSGAEPVSDYIIRLTGFGYIDVLEKPPLMAAEDNKWVLQMRKADALVDAGKSDAALALYQEAREKMELTPKRFENWLPVLINALGVCAYRTGKHKLAMEHFEISLRRIQAAEDPLNEADVFQNLAEAAFHGGDFKKSKHHADRSRRLNLQLKRRGRVIENFYWLGRAYQSGRRVDRKKAEAWFDKAEEAVEKFYAKRKKKASRWLERIEQARNGKVVDEDDVVKRFKESTKETGRPLHRRQTVDIMQFLHDSTKD